MRKRYDELLEKIRRAEQADPQLPPEERGRLEAEAEEARQELAERLAVANLGIGGGPDQGPIRTILRALGLTRSELVALALPGATVQERAAAEQALLEAEVGAAAEVPPVVVQALTRLVSAAVDADVLAEQLRRRYAAWRESFGRRVAQALGVE